MSCSTDGLMGCCVTREQTKYPAPRNERMRGCKPVACGILDTLAALEPELMA